MGDPLGVSAPEEIPATITVEQLSLNPLFLGCATCKRNIRFCLVPEMFGTVQNRKLLSAIIKVTASLHPRATFPLPHNSNSGRAFTITLPRKAPNGFSVSFAPDPEGLHQELSAARQTGDQNRWGRKKDIKNAEQTQRSESRTLRKPRSEYTGTNSPLEVQFGEIATRTNREDVAQVTISQPESKEDSTTSTGDATVSLESPDGLEIIEMVVEQDQKPKKKHRPKDRNQKAKLKKMMEDPEFLLGSGFVVDKTPISQPAPTPPPTVSNIQLTLEAESEDDLCRAEVIADFGLEADHHSETRKAEVAGRWPTRAVQPKDDPRKIDAVLSFLNKSNDSATEATTKKMPIRPPPKKEPWQVQKQALQRKFGEEGWKPRKKLSPDTIEGIRALHDQYPDKYTTPVLSQQFQVSAEAIRRILKSKWRPDPNKMVERRERWAKRHDRIWDQQSAIGLRPARRKDRKVPEPGEMDEGAELAELHQIRQRGQAQDMET